MKTKPQRIIVPVWAQRIEVERDRDMLHVNGWGRLSGPIDGRTLDLRDATKLDILKRLRRYSLRQQGDERVGENTGIYQFANANDDDKLIAFIGAFGPVWGTVLSSRVETDDTTTLTVFESLRDLRRGQEIFAATISLLQELNRNAKADPEKMIAAMKQIAPPQLQPSQPTVLLQAKSHLNVIPPLPSVLPIMSTSKAAMLASLAMDIWHSTGVPKADKRPAIISLAQYAMCDQLNHHVPVLVPVNGEAAEIPFIPDEGIREALYFQLRLDYLAQRQIGTCLNCGGYFSVLRRGARACGDGCRTALRNQKYWNLNKGKVNRDRRKKRAAGR